MVIYGNSPNTSTLSHSNPITCTTTLLPKYYIRAESGVHQNPMIGVSVIKLWFHLQVQNYLLAANGLPNHFCTVTSPDEGTLYSNLNWSNSQHLNIGPAQVLSDCRSAIGETQCSILPFPEIHIRVNFNDRSLSFNKIVNLLNLF